MFTGRSCPEAKSDFYRELFGLFRSVRSTNVVVVPGDFKVLLAYLAKAERHIGDRFFVVGGRTDNGSCLIQVCSDPRLFREDQFLS